MTNDNRREAWEERYQQAAKSNPHFDTLHPDIISTAKLNFYAGYDAGAAHADEALDTLRTLARHDNAKLIEAMQALALAQGEEAKP